MQNHLLTALCIGICAGLIDVIPMLIQKLNKHYCLSAFLHYLFLGLIIPFINCGIPLWITGLIVSLLSAVPLILLVYPSDKKAIFPMIIFSLVLGAGIGLAGAKWIV